MAPPAFWLITVGLCLGCGVLVGTTDLILSIAISTCVVVAGVVWAKAERISIGVALVGAAFLVGGMVDLLGQFKFGSYSGLAGVTVLLATFLVFTIILPPTISSGGLPPCTWWLFAFAAFSTASIIWTPVSVAGIQNLLVYDTFVGMLWAASRAASSVHQAWHLASNGFLLLTLASSALYVGSLAVGGLGTGSVVGSRGYGLVGMLAVAWFSTGTIRKREQALLIAVLALIGASLSRLALIVAAALLCLSRLGRKGASATVRFVLAGALVGAVAVAVVIKVHPIDVRFFQGDLQSFGGVKINVTGRSVLWRHAWDAFLQSPIIGHGAGSADNMIIALGLGASHPHNDYLRFLDDFGAVGFSLWVVGTVAVLRHLWIRWRSSLSDEERQLYGTAVLGLFGVSCAMLTDNAVIYIYVMAPLGAVMGLAMGCGQYSVTPHSSESPVVATSPSVELETAAR